ncbi:MAG: methyltransferase domain-containing protein [Planctomycetota bacterium]
MVETASLRDAVQEAYSAAARQPEGKHTFPVGRRFAESVGYPRELLDSLPAVAVTAFAGVSNVALWAEIPPGCVVLDLGCGAGLDTLIAGRRTGASGKVHGVDFSAAMQRRAQQAVEESGAENVELHEADAEELPLPDAPVDVTLVNGIFNLNPRRTEIFNQLARVVRPRGEVFGAELILAQPLPDGERTCAANWLA